MPAAARRSIGHRRRRLDACGSDRHLGVAADKIDVAPLGVAVQPDTPATPAAELRASLDLDERPLALSLSAKRPHKNLPRLLRARPRWTRSERPSLVVPGYPTPHEAELRGSPDARHRRTVRLPHWLPAEDLEGLYALAAAVVFPSLYEGFGLPVLEAMARGVPVACSSGRRCPRSQAMPRCCSIPRTSAIRAALERLLATRAGCPPSRSGPRAGGGFSWGRTAELTAASYERAIRGD